MNGQVATTENRENRDPYVEVVAEQMGSLTVTTEVSISASSEQTNPKRMDLDKRIRALKKRYIHL